MKMEPIVSSETSAIRTPTPGNYPKRNKLNVYSLHVTGKPNTLILYIKTSAAKSAQVREKRRQKIIWSLSMKISELLNPLENVCII